MIFYLSEFYSFIYLFIYLLTYSFTYLFIIYLFYLFMRYLSEKYLPKIYHVLFLRMFYILWFINTIVLILSYIVYRKEKSKNRGKNREYDKISQIIKKKCYL